MSNWKNEVAEIENIGNWDGEESRTCAEGADEEFNLQMLPLRCFKDVRGNRIHEIGNQGEDTSWRNIFGSPQPKL